MLGTGPKKTTHLCPGDSSNDRASATIEIYSFIFFISPASTKKIVAIKVRTGMVKVVDGENYGTMG